MSTIGDVAKRAGVSAMTVSRVINNSGYISQETRERVERAIAELGYVPNVLARSLRFKQTKTIALILTDITNPFFTAVARGVEDTARKHDFSVIFCNTDESEDEESQYIRVLLQKQVDGILLVPSTCSVDSVSFLQEHGTPVVILDRRIPGDPVDCVCGDSEEGSYQLVKHLLDLGHTQIAALTGPQEISTAADRVTGYLRALKEAGLDHTARIYYAHYSEEAGYQMTKRMLAEVMGASPSPTALFAGNNFIAVGAYHALTESGLRVPDDVSLVAFDDLPTPLVLDPFLTVVVQPAYQMGQRATELLLARLKGKGPQSPQVEVLPTQIIVRQSSGRIPSTS